MLHYPETTKSQIKKYLLLFMTVSCTILYILYTAALVPLYTYFSTNIIFMGTWLPFVIRILLELIDVAVFSIVYFSIMYAFFRMSSKKVAVFPVVYILLSLLRRAVSMFAEFISSGYVGPEDLLSLGLYYVLDILQLLAVLAVVIYEYHKYSSYINVCRKSEKSLPKLLPLTKVYDKNNPLSACTLKLSLLVAGIKIATRIISDIYYGAPESVAEGLVMVAYYMSDLLNGIIFYAMIWFLLSHINKKETALSNKQGDIETT